VLLSTILILIRPHSMLRSSQRQRKRILPQAVRGVSPPLSSSAKGFRTDAAVCPTAAMQAPHGNNGK